METMGVLKSIAAHQNAVNPVSMDAGDYIDERGLIVCGVCGRRKQTRIKIGGEEIKVPCICDCRKKELESQEQEERERENQRQIERLRSLSMMSGKFKDATFNHYIRRPENEKALKVAVNYVRNYKEMAANNQGLIFYGPVGTGKSYTAACIANALLDQRRSVIMTSFVKLLQDFSNKDSEDIFMQTLETASLVIIDDLGAERNTEYALEKIYNVIDSRVRANKPLILTTNLEMRDMEQPEDIRYGRIYDRIFEVCYPVEIKGGSMRAAQAAAKRIKMQELLEKG